MGSGISASAGITKIMSDLGFPVNGDVTLQPTSLVENGDVVGRVAQRQRQDGEAIIMSRQSSYNSDNSVQSDSSAASGLVLHDVTVSIRRDRYLGGFGFTAGGEKPLVVRSVEPGGPSCGKLEPRDEIIRVNEEFVVHLPRDDVIERLRHCDEAVTLTVRRTQGSRGRPTAVRGRKRVRFAEDVASDDASDTADSSPSVDGPCELTRAVADILKVFLHNEQTKTFSNFDRQHTTVADVLTSLCEKLQIAHSEYFGLVLMSTDGCSSQDSRKVALLSEDIVLHRVAERVHSDTGASLQCWFNVVFIPTDLAQMADRDPGAFHYLYLQCCSEVIGERFAAELDSESVLNLASLQLLQYAVEARLNLAKYKNAVRTLEKRWGLERFLPPSVLQHIDLKYLRRRLAHYMQLNHSALANQQQQQYGWPIAGKAIKLRYIQVLSGLGSFGGFYFNAALSDMTAAVRIFVGPQHGIEYFLETSRSPIAEIRDLTALLIASTRRTATEYRRIGLQVAPPDSTPGSQSMEFVNVEVNDVGEFVTAVSGYFRLFTARLLPVTWPEIASRDSNNNVRPNGSAGKPGKPGTPANHVSSTYVCLSLDSRPNDEYYTDTDAEPNSRVTEHVRENRAIIPLADDNGEIPTTCRNLRSSMLFDDDRWKLMENVRPGDLEASRPCDRPQLEYHPVFNTEHLADSPQGQPTSAVILLDPSADEETEDEHTSALLSHDFCHLKINGQPPSTSECSHLLDLEADFDGNIPAAATFVDKWKIFPSDVAAQLPCDFQPIDVASLSPDDVTIRFYPVPPLTLNRPAADPEVECFPYGSDPQQLDLTLILPPCTPDGVDSPADTEFAFFPVDDHLPMPPEQFDGEYQIGAAVTSSPEGYGGQESANTTDSTVNIADSYDVIGSTGDVTSHRHDVTDSQQTCPAEWQFNLADLIMSPLLSENTRDPMTSSLDDIINPRPVSESSDIMVESERIDSWKSGDAGDLESCTQQHELMTSPRCFDSDVSSDCSAPAGSARELMTSHRLDDVIHTETDNITTHCLPICSSELRRSEMENISNAFPAFYQPSTDTDDVTDVSHDQMTSRLPAEIDFIADTDSTASLDCDFSAVCYSDWKGLQRSFSSDDVIPSDTSPTGNRNIPPPLPTCVPQHSSSLSDTPCDDDA